MALNKVLLQGRLTADPEMSTVGDDIHVATFRLAVDRDRTNKDGVREADFITVKSWRNLADFLCKYFVKGDAIVVDGRLLYRSWSDADGKTKSTLEVVADNLYFGGSKRDGGDGATQSRAAAAPANDDDLPF